MENGPFEDVCPIKNCDIAMLVYKRVIPTVHQTFQVPTMEVLTYRRCMDTAYGYGKDHPKIGVHKVQYPFLVLLKR